MYYVDVISMTCICSSSAHVAARAGTRLTIVILARVTGVASSTVTSNQKASGERCVGGYLPSLFSPGSGGSSGSSGSRRSSGSSVAPIPRFPRGFPFLSSENHVARVRKPLSVQ